MWHEKLQLQAARLTFIGQAFLVGSEPPSTLFQVVAGFHSQNGLTFSDMAKWDLRPGVHMLPAESNK